MREKSFETERSVSPRRKLSFSNSNLDDPSHLDTLYKQCWVQVVKGFHPVPRETAVRLAAIQCFIEFGPYENGKESSINAENLLPKEYARAKELEKNILQEYKESLSMFESRTAAKKRYCSICKNSATYGSVFFQVKEKESPTERRLIRRLFGINKDCVMSVDRKTKHVLKSWPLEQIRRWAASPTTFNIDFGDYTDGYYSMQTLEGGKMKKIIGNYIDIILKKSQIVDHTGIEGDEGGIMLESHVSTAKALPFMVENGRVSWRQTSTNSNILSPEDKRKLPTTLPFDDFEGPVSHVQVHRPIGGIAVKSEKVYYNDGYGTTLQSVKTSDSSCLSKAIDHLLTVVELAQKSINQPTGHIQLPQIPGKSQEEQVLWLFQVGSESVRERLAVLVATVAQIIEWTSITTPRTDEQIKEAIVSTSSTLHDLAACVRELAYILPDKRLATELLQRTHKLFDVFSLFLEKLESQDKRTTFLSAASIVGETASALMNAIEGQRRNEAQMFYDLLNDRIQNIATSTANLVLQAKTIPAICPDAATKDKLVQNATKLALSTSELIALTRVLALILSHPACQERVVESVQKVAFTIEEMLDSGNVCKGGSADQQRTYEQLLNSAHFANNALHQLLKQIQA